MSEDLQYKDTVKEFIDRNMDMDPGIDKSVLSYYR